MSLVEATKEILEAMKGEVLATSVEIYLRALRMIQMEFNIKANIWEMDRLLKERERTSDP